METPGSPKPSSKSGELAAEVVQDVSRLVSLEIALAKQELRELLIRNAVAVAFLAAAGLLCILAILVAVPVAIVLLVGVGWVAAAIWAGAYIAIGILLALVGRARLRIALPQRTIASLKETKSWALQRLRSTSR
jgi:hypothetical protein